MRRVVRYGNAFVKIIAPKSYCNLGTAALILRKTFLGLVFLLLFKQFFLCLGYLRFRSEHVCFLPAQELACPADELFGRLVAVYFF